MRLSAGQDYMTSLSEYNLQVLGRLYSHLLQHVSPCIKALLCLLMLFTVIMEPPLTLFTFLMHISGLIVNDSSVDIIS